MDSAAFPYMAGEADSDLGLWRGEGHTTMMVVDKVRNVTAPWPQGASWGDGGGDFLCQARD